MATQENNNDELLHKEELPEKYEDLSPEISEAIKELSQDKRIAVIRAIKGESFSGPIPHPELLKKYDQIQSGFAERIVRMAEKQLDHRIECENKVVESSISESKRGQNYGLAVSLLFLIASVILGLLGHDWLAGTLGAGTLVSLVAIFITGRKAKE